VSESENSPDLLRRALSPSMDSGFGRPQLSHWAAALVSSAGTAEAGGIADAIIGTWREIALALGPVIGRGGVAALYRRSLYVAAREHPWLRKAYEGTESTMDLAALRLVLLPQGGAAAAAAGGTVLQAFHDLVFSLIGESLAEQLLRNVWALPATGGRAASTTP
jgi:hypothetical protein